MNSRHPWVHLVRAASFVLVMASSATAAHHDCPGMEVDALGTLDDCVTHHFEAGEIETVGVYQSLFMKALASQEAADRGNTGAAIGILQGFIEEVEALSGVLITGSAVHLAHHAEMGIDQIAG